MAIVCVLLAFAYIITHFQMVKRVLAIGILGAIFVGYFMQFHCKMYENALLVYLVFFILIEEIQLRWVKAGDTNLKNHMVSSTPFLLILCVGLGFCKAPEDPYDWKFVQNILSRSGNGYCSVGEIVP